LFQILYLTSLIQLVSNNEEHGFFAFYINIHRLGGCFAFHIAKHEIMHHKSLWNCMLYIFMQLYVQLA